MDSKAESGPALPSTRVPTLHTLDLHTEKPRLLNESKTTRSIVIRQESNGSWELTTLFEAVAHFLGAFTGLEALCFLVNDTVSPKATGLIIVEVTFPDLGIASDGKPRKVLLKKWAASGLDHENDATGFGVELHSREDISQQSLSKVGWDWIGVQQECTDSL